MYMLIFVLGGGGGGLESAHVSVMFPISVGCKDISSLPGNLTIRLGLIK